ncbi:MAG TPA: hypothetical protein VFI68_02215, partial [Anaerolineales bacterium]|nr:hypothetical protein [Anaerolineales bacterium]
FSVAGKELNKGKTPLHGVFFLNNLSSDIPGTECSNKFSRQNALLAVTAEAGLRINFPSRSQDRDKQYDYHDQEARGLVHNSQYISKDGL